MAFLSIKLVLIVFVQISIIVFGEESIDEQDYFTIDAFRGSRNLCNTVSDCPAPARSVCCGGKCYKECSNDDDCADKFTCTYENLCKPKQCKPCQKGPTCTTADVILAKDISMQSQILSTAFLIKMTSIIVIGLFIVYVLRKLWNVSSKSLNKENDSYQPLNYGTTTGSA